LEFTSTIPKGAVFGIANVKSKNCSCAIGYFLGESELTLLLPETCLECPKASSCSKEFGRQAVNKYNQKNKFEEIHLPLWDE
jgi:hypothetical protein